MQAHPEKQQPPLPGAKIECFTHALSGNHPQKSRSPLSYPRAPASPEHPSPTPGGRGGMDSWLPVCHQPRGIALPPSAPRALPAALLSLIARAARFQSNLFPSPSSQLRTCELKQVFLCQQPDLRVLLLRWFPCLERNGASGAACIPHVRGERPLFAKAESRLLF